MVERDIRSRDQVATASEAIGFLNGIDTYMNDEPATRQVKVSNPQGLHARPAHALVNLASRFQSEIGVIRDHERADGKSILSVLTLAAEQGTELIIEARGEDAKDALDALEHLFLEGFGDATSSDD